MALPRIVLFIIYLFSCKALPQESEVPSERISINTTAIKELQALSEKPFNIVFDDVKAREIRCKYLRNDVDVQCEACKFNQDTTSVIEINSVINDMSTQWNCSITLKNDDESIPINGNKSWYTFYMRVKRAKTVNLKIVGKNETFDNTDLSRKYDGVYMYLCEEGYTVDLSFENIYKEGNMIMRYYDAQDVPILESETVIHPTSLTFRQLMTSTKQNGSYVECTYTSTSPGVSLDYTYRTIFIVREKSAITDDFIVTINNVKLKPGLHPNWYDYQYMDGEQITAACENTKIPSDKMNGSFIDTQQKPVDSVKLAQGFVVNTTLLKHQPTASYLSSFICISSEDRKVAANIKFFVGLSNYPLVHGLRAKDILLQYSKNGVETITKYQYTENEAFNLHCLADENWKTYWIFGDKQIPGYESGNFTLKAEHNNWNITCEAKQTSTRTRTMVIVFQLAASDDGYLNITMGKTIRTDNGSSLGVIIGCVVGILAVLVCAIFGYCRYMKKRDVRIIEQRQNINQAQSDIYDYTYIEAGAMVENNYYCGSSNYKVPQDVINSSKNPAESHYTEIGDHFNNKNENKPLTYDVPYAHLKKDNNINLNNVNCENRNQENSNKGYSNLQKELNTMQYSNLKSKNTNYENF